VIKPPDYELAEMSARQKNAEALRGRLMSADVREKIRNWADRYNLEEEFVLYKLKTDEVFALHFIKDPVKQSVHQKVAAAHLDKIPLVIDFEMLPSGGDNSEFVFQGTVQTHGQLKADTTPKGKSIDFKWHFEYCGKELRVYATHKHTKDDGGGQDHQFADIKRFLEAASYSHAHDKVFMAICDGPYYQRPTGAYRSRLELLNTECVGRRSVACTIAEVPQQYARFINLWLKHHSFPITEDLANQLAVLEDVG
jgi:hypothetical protein